MALLVLGRKTAAPRRAVPAKAAPAGSIRTDIERSAEESRRWRFPALTALQRAGDRRRIAAFPDQHKNRFRRIGIGRRSPTLRRAPRRSPHPRQAAPHTLATGTGDRHAMSSADGLNRQMAIWSNCARLRAVLAVLVFIALIPFAGASTRTGQPLRAKLRKAQMVAIDVASPFFAPIKLAFSSPGGGHADRALPALGLRRAGPVQARTETGAAAAGVLGAAVLQLHLRLFSRAAGDSGTLTPASRPKAWR